MNSPRYFTVPLTRGYTAHIRAADLAVIFAQGAPSSAEVFARHSAAPRLPAAPPEPRAFSVYLILTEQCNLRCLYCDVLDKVDYATQPPALMTWETAQVALDAIAAKLAAEPGRKAQLTFFGGEPLLNWALLARLCEAVAVEPRIEKMLVTNGTLLTRERAEFLRRHHVYTVVSLDGRAEANDRIRRTRDGAGSFAAVAAGLRQLMDVSPGVFGISCTVGNHNAATLPAELRFLHETFAPCSIGINLYHYLRDGGSPVETDAAVLLRAFLEAFHTARTEGIVIYQFVSILKAFLARRYNREHCPACADKLLFTPHGTVGRCETLVFYEPFCAPLEALAAGNLPSRLDWSRYTPDHEPACQACAARWICPGSCVYDQYVLTGVLGGVDARRCDFHRALLNELLGLTLESLLAESGGETDVLLPEARHFAAAAGRIPMEFPPHTL